MVGGGLAGLVCAHRLVHEASDRLGGRVWTIRGAFADGQIAEHGGELIDSDHVSMRRLVAELGLSLDNVIAAEKPGTGDIFYFNGARYPVRQAVADFGAVYPKLKRDLAEAGYPTLHNHHKPRGVELDHISIADWLSENVPGGLDSNLGGLLDVAYNTEFGADISDQTSLNLLYLLGYSGGGRLRLFGASNAKFRVQGGNDQVVQRLAGELEGQLALGSELVEIKRVDDGSYRLTFDGDGGTKAVKAQRAVGRDFGGASAGERARRFFEQLEPVLPGVPENFNGRAVLDYWTGRPFTRDSYAYYRVGQMTAFAGVEGKPSGNCHFAGEQTSYTFQGYMEGAVKSGERAAGEVAASLGGGS